MLDFLWHLPAHDLCLGDPAICVDYDVDHYILLKTRRKIGSRDGRNLAGHPHGKLRVAGREPIELALPDIYIILLTAKGQEVDRLKGQEVGADVYMTKPFDPEAILNKAREVLALS